MKEPRALHTKRPAPPAPAKADLALLRHQELRLAAPIIQHELNNALMVLASNLELLGRGMADGAPRRQLDRATEAMRRLDRSMRGFLDAARREAAEPAILPPHLAIQPALPLLRLVLGARFGLDLEVAEGVWPVALDRARLDLALLALMRDAAGRMAPGARIAARVENREPAEVALHLSLPVGAQPDGEAARLLEAAAAGGRLVRDAEGIALIWPRAEP